MMKSYIHKIMLMTLMLFAASVSVTSVEADAKAYQAKTVKVISGKLKTVKTKKKIKKVSICSKNKNFMAYKVSDKKFELFETDCGKTQTVKVKYTNGCTQKYKINTVFPSYAKKIVDELKPLLADPDKGLLLSLADWEKQIEKKEKKQIYSGEKYEGCEIKLVNRKGLSRTSIGEMTVDDIMKNYTASQKKALILEIYFRRRMEYGDCCFYRLNRESNKLFKLLYKGKFKGWCEDGAAIAYDICKYLGIKAYYVSSDELNHAWCCVYATDKNGKPYWHGIFATSYSYNLKASIPARFNYGEVPTIEFDDYSKKRMTKAKLKKYMCRPNASTWFVPNVLIGVE